jgi:hypothetical protein
MMWVGILLGGQWLISTIRRRVFLKIEMQRIWRRKSTSSPIEIESWWEDAQPSSENKRGGLHIDIKEDQSIRLLQEKDTILKDIFYSNRYTPDFTGFPSSRITSMKSAKESQFYREYEIHETQCVNAALTH